MKTLKWRFGLSAMLFATFCIAGYFAGYRYGGTAKDKQMAALAISVVNYDVREFLDDENPRTLQLSTICELLTKTIEPDSWQRSDRSIVPYPARGSIIVQQTGSCHAAIKRLFAKLRTLRKPT